MPGLDPGIWFQSARAEGEEPKSNVTREFERSSSRLLLWANLRSILLNSGEAVNTRGAPIVV